MPFFRGATNTTANHSKFNDVTGNQYNTDEFRSYGGHDRPSYNNTSHGDTFHGAITASHVGGRGSVQHFAGGSMTAPAAIQQQRQPLPVADADSDELLQAQEELVRVKREAKRYQQHADQLTSQLSDAQATITRLQNELAQYRPSRN